MGQNKYVESVFNEMKPQQITGTNLYYFQTQSGVNKNGYDAYMDYRLKKLGSTPNERFTTLRTYTCVIYKKEKNETIEEFINLIAKGLRQPLKIKRDGKPLDLFVTPLNQNFTADRNGNVLIKTDKCMLDNLSDVGDVLLSRDGEVLHDTKGSASINKADANGYYRLDVFKSETDRTDGKKDISRIDVNFLDPAGKKIRQDDFIVPKELPCGPQEIRYTRNHYATNSKGKKERFGGLYPAGYIVFRENTDRSEPKGLRQYRPRIVTEYYPNSASVVSKIITDVEASKKANIPYVSTFPRNINEYHKEAIARFNSHDFQTLRQFFSDKRNINASTIDLFQIVKRENDCFKIMSDKVKELRGQQTQ